MAVAGRARTLRGPILVASATQPAPNEVIWLWQPEHACRPRTFTSPAQLGMHASMRSFGYTLSSEEHPPDRLVTHSRRAEDVGFDFVSISDHFHPWVSAQGHSPFVWSVLGAIAASTEEIQVAVGVTCPTTRIHPAIVAQATATSGLLLPGRFSFGVGTGEALNEHILGHRWPRWRPVTWCRSA
jgi:alkanesulfonate monooxygenase SsuD/methylene tetrahydromethanopterin reductase-like flavin-dependent oxidoreductase (luciferase family)